MRNIAAQTQTFPHYYKRWQKKKEITLVNSSFFILKHQKVR